MSDRRTFWMSKQAISRRTVLRAAGVSVALPMLESMSLGAGATPDEPPRRMACIMSEMGFIGEYFFPKKNGPNFELTDYLKPLEAVRNKMTVFSGMSLPDVDGAHDATHSFLSGAPHPSSSSFKNSVSIDQLVAQKMGHETRFPTLPLSITGPTSMMSVTPSGVTLPSIRDPEKLYEMMFVQGTKEEVERQLHKLDHGKSVLDQVRDRAKRLSERVTKNDRDKIDEYLTSVREAERRLQAQVDWIKMPKPKVEAPKPKPITDMKDVGGKIRAMYDMVYLAFVTDSTRLVTIYLDGGAFGNIYGLDGLNIADGWHPLTHMPWKQDKRAILKQIDLDQHQALAYLVKKFDAHKENGRSMLDKTMVLHGSNLGDSNAHLNTNLPTLLVGGEFKHAGHLAFDKNNNYPQTNLYLSMLQRMGLEIDRFSSSTGTMRGLD